MVETTDTDIIAAPDEHHGHGGSYVVGEDGRRTLVERTGQAETQPAAEPQPKE